MCLEIASGKTLGLAQLYDELVRREWAEKAKRGMHLVSTARNRLASVLAGDIDFDVNKASLRRDNDVFERAVDQLAAMQNNRGKGVLHFPFTHSGALLRFASGASRGGGAQMQRSNHNQGMNRQQPKGQGKNKRRERCRLSASFAFAMLTRARFRPVWEAQCQQRQGQRKGKPGAVGPLHIPRRPPAQEAEEQQSSPAWCG